MDKKQEEQYKLFAKAFHEVVPPLLKNMATKDDIKTIREEMVTKDDLNKAVYKIESRIDKIDDRMDRHGKILDNQDRKINNIETNFSD